MEEKQGTWNFAVVGCGRDGVPHYLGFFDTFEEAAKYQKNMEMAGWRRLAVFDAALQEVRAPNLDNQMNGEADLWRADKATSCGPSATSKR